MNLVLPKVMVARGFESFILGFFPRLRIHLENMLPMLFSSNGYLVFHVGFGCAAPQRSNKTVEATAIKSLVKVGVLRAVPHLGDPWQRATLGLTSAAAALQFSQSGMTTKRYS